MPESALDRAIAFASLKIPDAMEANEIELHSYTGTVTVKGIRLFAKRGWPNVVQVLIGKRWVTVIRGVDPSIGANFGITPRGIKAKIRNSRLAQKR